MIRNCPTPAMSGRLSHPHACTEAEAEFLEACYASELFRGGDVGSIARRAFNALARERWGNDSQPPTKVDVSRAHAGAMPGPFVSVDLTKVADGDTVDLPGRKVTFRVERRLQPITAPVRLPIDLALRCHQHLSSLVHDGDFEDDGNFRVTFKVERRGP